MLRKLPPDSEINKYKGLANSYCINADCPSWCLIDRFGCNKFGLDNATKCSKFIKHVGQNTQESISTIKEQVALIKEDVKKLEVEISKKKKQIKKLYESCTHDYETVMKGYEEDIIICKLCGHEDSIRRTM